MAAETVVDDTYGNSIARLRAVVGLRLCFGSGAVYLYVVLNALPEISTVNSDRLDAWSSFFSAAGEHICVCHQCVECLGLLAAR